MINYSIPQNPEAYVHRIGRTGREGKRGRAITFVAPWESPKLRDIERVARVKIKEMTHPTGHGKRKRDIPRVS